MIRARLRFSDRGIALGALAVLIVSVAFVIKDGALTSRNDLKVFGAFALLVAASEMFEVMLPNNVAFSLGIAPAIGFALLGSIDPAVRHKLLPEILTMFVVGIAIASVMRASMKKPLQLLDAGTHLISLAAGAAVYHAFAVLAYAPPGYPLVFDTCKAPTTGCNPSQFTDLSVFGLVAMLLVILIIETTLNTLRTVDRERIPFAPVFIGGIRSTGALHLSIMSVGALLAIAYPPLKEWAFPLFLAPLAATQFAFRQFASIRKTYLQTIAALSRVPEMAGYTQPGHSKRVAELSVEIARELGVNEQAITEIEYAALLHDIGRVSIPDPADAANASHLELALTGSGIVRETGHFPRVADMIEKQYEPYRRRGEDANPDLLLGAKIIKVASGYDDLARPGSAVALSTWDVLERLHLGMAYEYDPQVIQALTRVLEKRGEA
ncbi:MAG: HD-GYP domain-containing protein [Actinomycetota bacterium]